MKSKVLPLSFPLFLLFAAPTTSFAYIGNPSFSLDEDYDYRSLREDMERAKLNAERTDHRAREATANLRNQRLNLEENQRKLIQIPGEISVADQRIQTLQAQINTLQMENVKIQEALVQAQAANDQNVIKELNSKAQQNAQQINENQNQIAKANQRIQELNRALSDLQRDIPTLEQSVRGMVGELNHIEAEVRRQREQAHRAISDFERFARDLEIDIERYNNAGANDGENDGHRDGSDTAYSMGPAAGQEDGRNDGLNDGTSAGRQRDYNNGQSLGLTEGRKDGISKGTQEGKHQGIVQALTEVGTREGIAAGADKAQKSDADKVGSQQGTAAGLSRASATGKVNGIKLANEQGLTAHESGNLHKVELNGAYSGLFSRSIPHLPTNFKGRNHSPSPSYGREILRRAFLDGYEATYAYSVVAEFERLIGSIYNSAYDSSYRASYDSAVAQTYRDSYDKGYNDGYNAIYPNQFEQSRKAQYAVSYKETLNNPDRGSGVYKESFKSNEETTYKNKYEEIRADKFAVVELDTFNKNIAQRTEEFRQRRALEVEDLFTKHPVLAFVSSDIHDGGVDGITKSDGVYQPGETIAHSVTIKNFGKQPMNDLTIISSTGQSQKLPQIPAESEVTIKGAIVSTIDPKTEQRQKHLTAIRIKAPRTSQDSLQAVHYQNAAENLLVNSDAKQVNVLYPIYVSGVENHFDSLRINQVQTLKLSLMNFSDIIYRDIDVEMVSNASTDIFIRKFAQIPEVNSGLELQDSRIMPERFDFGRTIEVRGVLKHNGVTLGVLEKPILFKVVK